MPALARIVACLLLVWASATTCLADPFAVPATPLLYGQVVASAGGTGKTFGGREIAGVMSWHGAGWLERPQRQSEERPDLLMQALSPKAGIVVADIGAGSGYYSRLFAKQIGPSGQVFAVEVQPEMLDILKKQTAGTGIKNIKPVLATETDCRLPPNSVDLALMVDVYHELLYPVELMQSLARAMKPGGQIAIVEYRAEDPAVPIRALHKMSETQIRKEAALHGLVWVKTLSNLPWQHVVILRK